ncbi:MAG: ferrous iron transport protein A [Blastocatellia bacterium]
MTLNDLEFGRTASVTAVNGNCPVSKRLMEMGIVPGTPVRKIKSAPFGDPIQIRVRNYCLAVRRSEAEKIEVTETGKSAGTRAK